MLDGDYPEYLKQDAAYKLIMPVIPPCACTLAGRAEINNAVSRFYRGGEPEQEMDESESLPESRRIYAFDYDFPYIYAAFLELYNIDLTSEELHWWQFRALFRSLHDCKFTEIMNIRATEITEDMTEKQREILERQQEAYALPISLAERRKIEQAQKMLV